MFESFKKKFSKVYSQNSQQTNRDLPHEGKAGSLADEPVSRKIPKNSNKNLTEMVFILDRSGSMNFLVSDTIGGFNGMIENQKKEAGEAVVTTVLFDNQYEILYENKNINEVEPLTKKTYYARGSTALLDAVGKTINIVDNRHRTCGEMDLPYKTLIIITTDGMENSSKEYNINTIKSMIEQQKEEYGWEFIFLGANIDAVSVAGKIGIDANRAVNYHADKKGTERNFEAINKACSSYRRSKNLMDDWRRDIDKDFYERKNQKGKE